MTNCFIDHRLIETVEETYLVNGKKRFHIKAINLCFVTWNFNNFCAWIVLNCYKIPMSFV